MAAATSPKLVSDLTKNKIKEALDLICKVFEIESLRKEQEDAIRAFISGKSIYISANTGFGKSLIFQSLPVIMDFINDEPGYNTLLVVSPLKSLIEDQVRRLGELGIAAIALNENEEERKDDDASAMTFFDKLKAVEEGCFSLVYTSPESMLSKNVWRKILASKEFRDHCIGVAVDEAHCIAQWGYSTERGSMPFRKWYGNMTELWSLLSKDLQFAIFTATASTLTRQVIFANLMLEPNELFVIESDPNRSNIVYITQHIENNINLENVFADVITDIADNGKGANRVIIFCQTRKQCATLFSIFSKSLATSLYYGTCSPKNRMVDMYHAGTPTAVKSHISREMASKESHLRVLCCTIAFGMGVNVKGVHHCIHFGVPQTIESYLQESGRIGRDGEQSFSLLLFNGLLSGRSSETMKNYVNTKSCRRVELMKHFPSSNLTPIVKRCECCDNCATSCECGNCKNWCLTIKKPEKIAHTKVRKVSVEEKMQIKVQLESYLANLNSKSRPRMVSLPSILLEFTHFQIDQVLESCHKIFNKSDVYSCVEIWRSIHAHNILVVLDEVFGDIEEDISDLELVEVQEPYENDVCPQWLDIRDDTEFSNLMTYSDLVHSVDGIIDKMDISGEDDSFL